VCPATVAALVDATPSLSTLDGIANGELLPKVQRLQFSPVSPAALLDALERRLDSPVNSTIQWVDVKIQQNRCTRDEIERFGKLLDAGVVVGTHYVGVEGKLNPEALDPGTLAY
jgi:hypothetical protein